MSETVIKIENLSKEYCLKQVGTGTFSHDLNRWWCRIRGKEDPYLKVGEVNDRAHKGNSDYVYALKDINLDVKHGEVLGIIGKNGAGKSTLLKILSKVTGPTTGSIKSKGRIASLLEVGTGFHPELTGRENIYMNGTIMGMTRKEISDKLDEIVAFAGVERYLDTPVKRYSSGMTVRLGFAVAAHLEPDILVVDEVLAVGDAEFQKKAIGKMKEVSEGHGRTVLFVSHNMAAVKNLCTRLVVLKDGGVSFVGGVEEGVNKYLSFDGDVDGIKLKDREDRIGQGAKDILLADFTICDSVGVKLQHVNFGSSFVFKVDYCAITECRDLLMSAVVRKPDGAIMFSCSNCYDDINISCSAGEEGSIEFVVKDLTLHPGEYNIDLYIAGKEGNTIDGIANAARLKIEATESYPYTPYSTTKQGFYVDHSVIHEVLSS